jgi:23S rRNA (pseudouridine1915-N3)-methyltransferase
MKVLIISPGKAHEPNIKDAIDEYQKRLGKAMPVEWAFPKPSDKQTEGTAILKQIKDDDFVLLLDERGGELDTPGFAKFLGKLKASGTKRLIIVIGGAFGVDKPVTARADLTLKLSALVFPHMLVRLILIEQLYRAHSILSGGKYHHA